jgi:hypothetical protein
MGRESEEKDRLGVLHAAPGFLTLRFAETQQTTPVEVIQAGICEIPPFTEAALRQMGADAGLPHREILFISNETNAHVESILKKNVQGLLGEIAGGVKMGIKNEA